MGMDEQLRRKLILFKEENRHSNQEVADMIKPCSGQSVGRWVVNKDSYISEENEEKLRELLKDVNIGYQGIENTEKLRNLIFSKSMRKGLSFDNIADHMGKIISSDELEILLSDNGAEFTPRTLSSLCAVLDITKKELPISEEDKTSLFINAMKADMLITEVNIFNDITYINHTSDTDLSFAKQKDPTEKYLVANLKSMKNHIGYRYPYDNDFLLIKKNDLLILSQQNFQDQDLIFCTIDHEIKIGFYNSEDDTITTKQSREDYTSWMTLYKVVKVIRDY